MSSFGPTLVAGTHVPVHLQMTANVDVACRDFRMTTNASICGSMIISMFIVTYKLQLIDPIPARSI